MVTGENDQRFVIKICFLEDLDQPPNSLVDPRTRLVILRQFFTCFCGVREECGNDDFSGVVKDLVDIGMRLVIWFVSEQIRFEFQSRCLVFASPAMGIRGSKVKKKRSIVLSIGEELTTCLRHLHCISTVASQIRFKLVNGFRCDVIFSNVPCAVPGTCHDSRQGEPDYVVKRRKLVEVVLVTVLSIAMVVQSAHHNTAARTAGGSGCKCISENHSVPCNGINRRGFCDRISVAAQCWTFIVRDDEQHISLRRFGKWWEAQKEKTGRQ